MVAEAFFLTVEGGQRYCVFHRPDGEIVRGAIVYVHPFAEEMNKSRRMAALQARALAKNGFAVLQVDLHGCGDSSGDFGDASWASWLADVRAALAWLRERAHAPLWLWGLRVGCLLASAAAAEADPPVNLLFWQPVLSGKQYLQQFLRLKTAGSMLAAEGKAVEVGGTEALRRLLAEGKAVEVAGYRLSPGLASGLEQAELVLPSVGQSIIWLEASPKTEATLLPVSAKRIEGWQANGRTVHGVAASSPAFWMTAEIAESPELLVATTRVMTEACGRPEVRA